MKQLKIKNLTRTRMPTEAGDFQLCYYQNNLDDKEHLALVCGEVQGQEDVLVRIHSECFTGDVLGSLRCDCGPQLQSAMHQIAAQGSGVILYLRQEGRGIGLLDKMRAYNLQDMGYDTVDANLLLGHDADERDYSLAAQILKDLGIRSVELLTNNPEKIEALEQLGVPVKERVAIETAVHAENAAYLQTKVARMRHLLQLDDKLNGYAAPPSPIEFENGRSLENPGRTNRKTNKKYPSVTLTYAQSLDGSITRKAGEPLAISGPESMTLTHRLRASHDAILVGIGTALADDPSLTVRLVAGDHPQPVILDSQLRFPANGRLFTHPDKKPWLFCHHDAPQERRDALEAAGATIFPIDSYEDGRLSLRQVLTILKTNGINSLMVEGGSQIITCFLNNHLVDRMILTIAPIFVGGLTAVQPLTTPTLPRLTNVQQEWLGQDLIVKGDVVWSEEKQ